MGRGQDFVELSPTSAALVPFPQNLSPKEHILPLEELAKKGVFVVGFNNSYMFTDNLCKDIVSKKVADKNNHISSFIGCNGVKIGRCDKSLGGDSTRYSSKEARACLRTKMRYRDDGARYMTEDNIMFRTQIPTSIVLPASKYWQNLTRSRGLPLALFELDVSYVALADQCVRVPKSDFNEKDNCENGECYGDREEIMTKVYFITRVHSAKQLITPEEIMARGIHPRP